MLKNILNLTSKIKVILCIIIFSVFICGTAFSISSDLIITMSADTVANTIEETIQGLSTDEPCTIVVTGEITNNTIDRIATTLGYNKTVRVELDLSKTTGLTSIDEMAFSMCSGLTSIIIPDSVTHIQDYAFFLCYRLANIIIPDSVTSIGDNAFAYCLSLTNMTIPDSITSIGSEVFSACKNLTCVTISNSETSIKAIIENISSKEPFTLIVTGAITESTINTIGDALKGIPSAKVELDLARTTGLTSLWIPDSSSLIRVISPNSVTKIENYAFQNCTNLTSVTIPNNVTSIGNSAFNGCTSLTSVTIPNNVTSIGNSAFNGCTSLTSVTIPNNVTSIGENAFNGCTSLTNMAIPDSVTSIKEKTFENCKSLTSITISNNVKKIEQYAFNGCSNLTKITIPDSVTSIEEGVFYNCTSLTSIIFNNPDTWYYKNDRYSTNSTEIIVTDSVTNATNLTETYWFYFWYQK